MREDPDIIKTLREEERLGLLTGMSQGALEELETPGEVLEDMSNENISVMKDDEETDDFFSKDKEKWDSILDSVSDWICLLDKDHRIIRSNKAVEEIFGISKSEYMGQTCCKIVHGSEKPLSGCPLEKMMHSHNRESLELQVPDSDLWLKVTVDPVTDEEGNVTGAVHVISDITERKKAEKKIKKNELKYRTLFESMVQGVFYQRADGTLIDVNKSALDMFGLTRDQFLGRDSYDPGWKVIREDDSDFPGEEHPSMTALKTGKEIKNVVAGVFNPKTKQYTWLNINAIPQFRPGEKKPYQVFVTLHNITALKKAEEKLSTIISQSPIPTAVGGSGGSIVSFNDALEKLIGYKCSDIRDVADWANKLYPDKKYREFVQKNIKQALDGKKQDCAEFTITCKNGTKKTVDFHTSFFRDGLIIQMMDITEKIKTEEKLVKSESKYRGLVEASGAGIASTDLKGRFTYVNDALSRMLGYSKEKIIGKPFDSFLHPKDKKKIMKYFLASFIKPKEKLDLQFRVIRKDGEIIHLYSKPTINKHKGKMVGFNAIIQDISQIKKKDEMLKESELRYRTLFETSPDSIIEVDDKGIIKTVNNNASVILGYTETELVGKHFSELTFLPKEKSKAFENKFRNILSGKKTKPFEFNLRKKDGARAWVEVHTGLIKKDGKITGFQAISRDITNRKKTEEKIRNILDSSPDSITVTNLDGIITECNDATLKLHGFSSKDEIIGKSAFMFFPKREQKRALENMQKTLNKGSIKNIEYSLLTKDGKEFPAELSAGIIKDTQDKPIAFVALTKDVIKRKESEDRIKKQNIKLLKLDQIKTDFLNTTSHELRTPMAAMKGYVQMMIKQSLGNLNEEQLNALNIVLRNMNRLDNLIQDLLDISQLESGTMKFIPEKININEMINDIKETMKTTADMKKIKIKTELDEKVPKLIADEERIKQVLLNLVDNAIKFSPEEASINLRVKKEKDNILLEVQDYGQGIPKNKQNKIFERFYQIDSGISRKYGGVGLGLAVSQGIIYAHGGKIKVESKTNEGCTFSFNLPIYSKKEAEDKLKDFSIYKF